MCLLPVNIIIFTIGKGQVVVFEFLASTSLQPGTQISTSKYAPYALFLFFLTAKIDLLNFPLTFFKIDLSNLF